MYHEITRFLLIDGSQEWIELLGSLEIKNFLDCSESEAKEVLRQQPPYSGLWAICLSDTDLGIIQACRIKKENPSLTVLLYSSGHPTGEVLLVEKDYFSARQLTQLVAPL